MLDQTLSSSQFYIDGFSLPYRLDRNCNGRGTMIFVKKDILSKLLRKHIFASDFEGLFVKIKYRKTKLKKNKLITLLQKNVQHFIICINTTLGICSHYDNFLLAEDFNAEKGYPCLSTFLYQHYLYNLFKAGTCFKHSSKPTSIDLFLTTENIHFQITVQYPVVYLIFVN